MNIFDNSDLVNVAVFPFVPNDKYKNVKQANKRANIEMTNEN